MSPQSFYMSFLPTFAVSTILGIFPMFPLGKNRLYTSKKLNLITAAILMFYTSCFVATIVRKSSNVVVGKYYKKGDRVSNFGLTMEFMFGLVVFYTTYFISFKRTQQVSKVMKNLNAVDNLLARIGQKFHYTRDIYYQLAIVLLGFSSIIVVTSMQNYNLTIEKYPPMPVLMWIILIYPHASVYFTNSQYAFTALAVYNRFTKLSYQLNKIKEDLFGSLMKVALFKTTTNRPLCEEQVEKVVTLAKVHAILCKAAHRTNLNYNVMMLPAVWQQFFLVLFSIFYYYWMHSSGPISAIFWLCWGALKCSEILHLAVACHLASREAEVVGQTIHKLLVRNINTEIEEKLLAFSQQILQSKFRFTLCGLFNLDATLLFNMVGSSTTFIVIMIQFQETATPTQCIKTPNVTLAF